MPPRKQPAQSKLASSQEPCSCCEAWSKALEARDQAGKAQQDARQATEHARALLAEARQRHGGSFRDLLKDL